MVPRLSQVPAWHLHLDTKHLSNHVFYLSPPRNLCEGKDPVGFAYYCMSPASQMCFVFYFEGSPLLRINASHKCVCMCRVGGTRNVEEENGRKERLASQLHPPP